MLPNKLAYSFTELLDEPLYFDIEGTPTGIVFNDSDREPLTLRTMYPHLQKIKLQELPRKKAFTDSEILQLHSDRGAGASIRTLARKYNKSTATIQKYLKVEVEH